MKRHLCAGIVTMLALFLMTSTSYADFGYYPGSMCQPQNDEADVQRTGGGIKFFNDNEAAWCPFVSTDVLNSSGSTLDTLVKIYDPSSTDNAGAAWCYGSGTSYLCGAMSWTSSYGSIETLYPARPSALGSTNTTLLMSLHIISDSNAVVTDYRIWD